MSREMPMSWMEGYLHVYEEAIIPEMQMIELKADFSGVAELILDRDIPYKMLMYNANQKKNPLIYGTVFASGTAQIKGNGKLIDS